MLWDKKVTVSLKTAHHLLLLVFTLVSKDLNMKRFFKNKPVYHLLKKSFGHSGKPRQMTAKANNRLLQDKPIWVYPFKLEHSEVK